MSDNHIVIERPVSAGGAVQVITLNRPDKKNAITRPMYAAMTQALRDGDGDDGVRVHVFLGQPGAFSAGNDMQDFMAYAMGGELGKEVLEFLNTLATVRKPIISGVDGLAIGIGTTLHLHCDLTFATSRSEFRTPFVDLALVPEAASSLIAPPVMGHQRAFALLAAGYGFSARQAQEAGIIFALVDEDALEDAVMQAAEALAAKPPQALAIARDLIRSREYRQDVLRRIDEEAQLFARQLRSAEAKAAFDAFMARKR